MTQEFTADYSKWIEYLDQLGYRKVVTCKDCKYSVDEYNDGECYCDYEKTYAISKTGIITVHGQKGKQTMTKTSIPILVDWESIKDHLAKSDIVEVIRCKDCTKYKHWECPIEQAGYRPKEDGYCFDAERKTDNA